MMRLDLLESAPPGKTLRCYFEGARPELSEPGETGGQGMHGQQPRIQQVNALLNFGADVCKPCPSLELWFGARVQAPMSPDSYRGTSLIRNRPPP